MPSANYDLRTATRTDEPALRMNWRASFGDPDDYLDFFFTRRFVPENTLVACANGTVVSQLFLLPTMLRTKTGLLPADYLFAAATHPDHRGQGVMAALLSKSRSLCLQRQKDAIVLLPGTRELYRYYEKHGFETAFSRRRWDVTRSELARLAVPAAKAQDEKVVLQELLQRRDGLCWDADALEYALAEHRTFRGNYAASAHVFVCDDGDDAVCLCAPQHFGECAFLLLALSDRQHFSLVTPADVPFGAKEDGGMLCRLCDKPVQMRDAFISFAME